MERRNGGRREAASGRKRKERIARGGKWNGKEKGRKRERGSELEKRKRRIERGGNWDGEEEEKNREKR